MKMSEGCLPLKKNIYVLSPEGVWFKPSPPTAPTPNKSSPIWILTHTWDHPLPSWPLPVDFPIALCCGYG